MSSARCIGANSRHTVQHYPKHSRDMNHLLNGSLQQYQMIICVSWGKVKTSVNGNGIPANTEISITGTTNQSFHDSTVLVETADVSAPEGLVIIPSVDKIKQGNIQCLVMNFSNCDLNLNKTTHIAQVTTCDVLCPNIYVTVTDEGRVLISVDNQYQQNAMLDFDFDKNKMTKRKKSR